jgi:hypothetical protein
MKRRHVLSPATGGEEYGADPKHGIKFKISIDMKFFKCINFIIIQNWHYCSVYT